MRTGRKLVRQAAAVLLIMILAIPSAFAGESGAFSDVPEELRPGKTERFTYTALFEGTGTCFLRDASGRETAVAENVRVVNGTNHLIWDGLTPDGLCPEAGKYTLELRAETGLISTVITIGLPAPRILDIVIGEQDETGRVSFDVECSSAGEVTVSAETEGERAVLLTAPVQEGNNTLLWDGRINGRFPAGGETMLQFSLTDGTGFSATKQNRPFEFAYMAEDEPDVPETEAAAARQDRHTVIPTRQTTPEQETSYWTLPIGVLDEERIWEVLMQPMTVIDGDQTFIYRLRATPDKSMEKENIVGEITYASQGVHVLETLDNGWTKVEAYNSSYGPKCKSRRGYGVTNELIVGYVETKKLKTVEPSAKMGLVIDKLNQTMYIFEDGKLTGSLLVSTGLNNATQSWNETPSGEYVMISKIGGFAAGNLWCAYGMRINGGCAIHEVPYIGNKDTPSSRRDYSSTVKLLGQKASHGCIRVQKATNEAGQNIKWLWNNMEKYTKVLIWEDSGRFLDYPDDATELYYNPNGGQYYHEAQYCTGVKERYLPLTAFTYGELENAPFASLKPCPNCCHTKRKGEIDELNRENGY